MINDKVIEKIYCEQLEENLISYLSQIKGIDLKRAMEIYYQSKLADKISQGEYGVQYLDYKVLAEILMETESELFK